MTTDSDLIRRSLDEPAAFGDLFHRHAAQIYRYVARRAGESVADDVTSETFLLALERRARFDRARESAAPWLLGIATNLVHRHRVAEARTLRTVERAAHQDVTDGGLDGAGDAMDLRREVERLARRLRTLSIADRDCLLLFAWEDLSYAQVAAALDIPVGTVRSRINRARRILRSAATERSAPTEKEQSHERTLYTADPA